MRIEKIEQGPAKEGFWSTVAFSLIILFTLVSAGITGMIFWNLIFSEPAEASGRSFIEGIGKLLASLLFILAAIIYLYVKGLLQDEYVTTIE